MKNESLYSTVKVICYNDSDTTKLSLVCGYFYITITYIQASAREEEVLLAKLQRMDNALRVS